MAPSWRLQRMLSLTLALCLLAFSSATSADNAAKAAIMIEQFVNAHNAARQEVGVPPLRWEPMLATFAHAYSNQRRKDCLLVHSTSHVFGENIFWGQGKGWSPAVAVAAWVAEKQYYNYNSNTCSGPDCSHYTQIVWRNTERVGCAEIICDSGDTFVTCEYYPPGNYVGDRPY